MSTTKYPVHLAEETDDEKLLKEKSSCCSTYSTIFWTLFILVLVVIGSILFYRYLDPRYSKLRAGSSSSTTIKAAEIPSTITEISSDVLTGLNSL